MKKDLMDILCCPVCKGELELKIEKQDKDTDEIIEGELICDQCDEIYSISEGIPDLLPPEMR